MKKLKSLLVTLAILLCAISASAHDFEVDGIYYNITDSEKLTVEVTYRGNRYNDYYNEYSGNVVISQTVTYNNQTFSVTTIGDDAFYGCSSLTSVTISNSVTSIGKSAFGGCNSLTSVHISDIASWCNIKFENNLSNPLYYAKHLYLSGKEITELIIPDGVNSISINAFCGCSSLTSVTIPNSVTSIGIDAFSDCNSLTSVHISDIAAWCNIKFEDYYSNPLYYAKHLYLSGKEITELIIPDGVNSIGIYAFYGCTSLTSVTIPNSVTSIGIYAFRDCANLTSITIPNSVSTIGSDAFNGTAWYKNQPDGLVYAGKVAYEYKGTMPSNTSIELADGTLGIADRAFYDCSNLTSITIPNSVTSIGIRAFYRCSTLTSITIPNSLTSIGSSAFADCSTITSITIPNSVTSIGSSAFSGCDRLTSIRVESGNSKYDSRDDCNAIIETETNILIIGCKSTKIPNSVISIGREAFSCCFKLTSITIPNSVTSIGSSAFASCQRLTSVTIPNSVASIDSMAFYHCINLTSVAIPNSVTYIDSYAFYNCTSLKSVKVFAEAPPVAYENTFSDYIIELCVPQESITAYQNTNPWSNFKSIRALTDEETGISNVQVLPVEVQANNGTIIVTGADDGTMVEVFDISGTKLGEAKTTFNTATINTEAQSGSVVIVKVGNKAIKIKI